MKMKKKSLKLNSIKDTLIYLKTNLFLVVLIGGQLGNFLNLKFLSNKLLTLITSGLVIFVALRIGLKIFG